MSWPGTIADLGCDSAFIRTRQSFPTADYSRGKWCNLSHKAAAAGALYVSCQYVPLDSVVVD